MAKNRKIASTKAAKPTKAEKRQTSAEVEVVEEKQGMGWEGGVAIVTAIVLVVAVLCVAYDLGQTYGQGIFCK
jgi:hypothetical protein